MADVQHTITSQQYNNLMKWHDILIHSDSPQATGRMKKLVNGGKVGYCCLGLAAETFDIPNTAGGGDGDTFSFFYAVHVGCFYGMNVGYDSFPNEDWMLETFGMNRGVTRMLADANDSGVSFKTIGKMVFTFASCAKVI